MSDQVLLDEIERLKAKNAKLVKSNKFFNRIASFVDRQKYVFVVRLCLFVLPIASIVWVFGGWPTDHFYVKYERSRIKIYQTYDWGMDPIVWFKYNPGPGEAVQKMLQIRQDWFELKQFEKTQ